MKDLTKKSQPKNSPEITSVEELRIQIESLKEQNAILRNIIYNMPGHVYWKDINGYYMGCNRNTLKPFNFQSEEEFIGKHNRDLMPLHLAIDLEKKEEVITHGAESLQTEENGFDQDGLPAVYLSHKMPLRNHKQEIIGIIGTSFDITDRKKIENDLLISKENAEIASRAKTDFIANMSHDIKTPLAGIIGVSELLCFRLTNENKELAETLLLSGRQLLNFIENCLEISKLENGDLLSLTEHFHVKGILNEICELFEPSIKAKQLQLNVSLDSRMPEYLIGSRASLYRILLNLVANAVKFTYQGHINIRFMLAKLEADRSAIVKIIVEDTGIGIAAENQQVIFDRFTRLVPSYKGTHEGSGIGLYLVQTFVTKLGGEVFVQSTPGVGSQFTVILPFKTPLLALSEYNDATEGMIDLRSTSKNIQQDPELVNFFNYNSPRVLLVEDNPIAQRIETTLLTSLNCKIDIAESGEKALKLFKTNQYDLILLDIGLPDIQGDEVSKRFREIEKASTTKKPAYIIALTAHTSTEMSQQYSICGINRTLSKPLLKRDAEKIIAEIITT